MIGVRLEARWSVNGAEAVLKLRAVRANDDFDDYWKVHLNKNDTESTRPAMPPRPYP
jgi:cephalosporin-C deacetylase-like acetyl esterase